MRRLPAKYEPTAIRQSAEETTDPVIADHRNFYKVEKCTKDKVDHMLYAAGSWTRRVRSSRRRSSIDRGSG